jgi:hypothetical protein
VDFWQSAVVRKKRILWVAVGVIALTTVWFALLRPRDEPKYQGRYLSEWAAIYFRYTLQSTGASGEDIEARNAILAIGTNAVPHFLNWVRYERSPWQVTLRPKLPAWIGNKKGVRDLFGDAKANRAVYGWVGINLLGTNAISAIPTLTAMLNDRTNYLTLKQATFALAAVGEVAVPDLQAAFTTTNVQFRWYVLHSVCALTRKLGHTNSTGPILMAALHDRISLMRWTAEDCLREIHSTNAPAK